MGKPHLKTLASGPPQIVAFRENPVKFAHQLLCNPKFSMLLKATQCDFLTSFLNINEKKIIKYLNPRLATVKGHMKRQRHGICSTTPKTPKICTAPIPVIPVLLIHVLPVFQQPPPHQGPAYGALQDPNLIGMFDDESIAKVFCFGAFADKRKGVVNNDLMGSFPFISLDGSIGFFVLYLYKANAILALPIAGLDNISNITAYKRNNKGLPQKGSSQK